MDHRGAGRRGAATHKLVEAHEVEDADVDACGAEKLRVQVDARGAQEAAVGRAVDDGLSGSGHAHSVQMACGARKVLPADDALRTLRGGVPRLAVLAAAADARDGDAGVSGGAGGWRGRAHMPRSSRANAAKAGV